MSYLAEASRYKAHTCRACKCLT